jgi:NADH dehydrogenase [ubiquinone] 1 alpha subcomplex assembly factor 1
MSLNNEIVIFDFNKSVNINKWHQTNDDVMGGVSNSKMLLNENGNGVFTGKVSLENNGGFTMTRLPLDKKITDLHKKVVLYLKGDGKEYQLRIKSISNQIYWYIHPFQTTTKMQQIEIPLNDFYPSYRGKKLKLDNFSSHTIKEIAILIGNKKNETFNLTIEKIAIN